jgi:hypothetical protein
MLDILLLILKIAGIVIAAVIILVLLIIAAVLFVPVRYDIRAEYYDKPTAVVRVSWLFSLLSGRAAYDEEFGAYVKILGFSLYNTEEKAPPKKRKVKKEKELRTVFDEPEIKAASEESLKQSKADLKADREDIKSEKLPEKETADSDSAVQEKESNRAENALNCETENQKKTKKKRKHQIKEYLCRIKKKIADLKEKILSLVKGIRDKTVSAKELAQQKLTQIKDTINDEENRELVSFLWTQAKAVLKKIRPKKYKLYLRYGFDDPETTGNIAVRLAVFYGLLGMNMDITPDFEQKIFEGNVYLKGRIRICGLLIIAVRVYRNQTFRRKILKKA